MNKKVIIIAVVVVVIIGLVLVFRLGNENETENIENLEENQITKEEFNDNLIGNVEEKLSSAGIEIVERGSAKFKSLEGNEYVVMENGEETEKTFEMYPINLKEKRETLGENVSDGKVTIDRETQGILSSSVLIVNISDENLMNQIIDALDI